MVVRFVIIRRLAISQRDDVLRSCVGDSAVAKQALSFVKALLQIGAAAGTQVVDGFRNSLIAFISGNIHPSTRYRCAVGKGNQCDKATCALAITLKEIDGRSLSILQAGGAIVVFLMKWFLAAHRAGGIDDEHRCGLRVAGLGLGGRVHLHFQLDRVLVGGAGRLSGLVDGINAIRQIWTVCASSPDAILIIIALDYVLRFADLVRQHVQRQ